VRLDAAGALAHHRAGSVAALAAAHRLAASSAQPSRALVLDDDDGESADGNTLSRRPHDGEDAAAQHASIVSFLPHLHPHAHAHTHAFDEDALDSAVQLRQNVRWRGAGMTVVRGAGAAASPLAFMDDDPEI